MLTNYVALNSTIDELEKIGHISQWSAQYVREALTKVAGEAKDKRKKKPSNVRKFLAGLALKAGGNVGEGFALDLAENIANETLDPRGDLHYALNSKHPIPLEPDSTLHLPSYSSPYLTARGIGRTQVSDSGFGRLLQAGTLYNRPGVGTLSGFLTGAFSDNPTVHKWGRLAPALLTLPQLGLETAAGWKGLKALRQAGANPQQIGQYIKMMAPIYGAHLAQAARTVGSAYMGQALGGGLRGIVGME
jgi:hypothetical protein